MLPNLPALNAPELLADDTGDLSLAAYSVVALAVCCRKEEAYLAGVCVIFTKPLTAQNTRPISVHSASLRSRKSHRENASPPPTVSPFPPLRFPILRSTLSTFISCLFISLLLAVLLLVVSIKPPNPICVSLCALHVGFLLEKGMLNIYSLSCHSKRI